MQKVIEGILVNVETTGNGKKKLVILPGWKAGAGEWMAAAQKLADKYTVYIVELPGMGGSGLPPSNWGIYEYTEFTKKVLKKLGVNKASVLGHSFGGRIGILLAAGTNIVEKLVLVDAGGMEIKNRRTEFLRFVKPLAGLFPDRVRDRFRSTDWREAGELKKVLARIVSQPLREELKKIKVPTFILWGEKDQVLSLAEAKMINKGIRKSVLRIVWGAGHWPHTEKYEEFMDILTEEGI